MPNNPRKQYRVIREIPNTGVAQLIVSRLGAEGIDVRLRNANSSSIYPLIGIGLRIEVDIEQFEQAETLIQQMEEDAMTPNPDIDFRDADHNDIQFEKEIYEQDQKMSGNKPSILIYLLIIVLITLVLVTVSLL